MLWELCSPPVDILEVWLQIETTKCCVNWSTPLVDISLEPTLKPWTTMDALQNIVNQFNIGEDCQIVNVSKITKDLRFIIAEVTIPANASSDQVTSDTDVVIIFMKKKTSCKYYYFIILKMYIYNKSFLKIRCNHFITL